MSMSVLCGGGYVCMSVSVLRVCVIDIQVTIGAKKSIRSIEAVGKGICEEPGVNAGDGPRSCAKASLTVNY